MAGSASTRRHCERSEAIQRLTKGHLDRFVASTGENPDCFVAFAPLRKRFAFVAGNGGLSWLAAWDDYLGLAVGFGAAEGAAPACEVLLLGLAACGGGSGGPGATGPLRPTETEMPNSRHCRFTGA